MPYVIKKQYKLVNAEGIVTAMLLEPKYSLSMRFAGTVQGTSIYSMKASSPSNPSTCWCKLTL